MNKSRDTIKSKAKLKKMRQEAISLIKPVKEKNYHPARKDFKKNWGDKVVFLERDMGTKIVQRLITPDIKDYIELEPDCNIIEINALPEFVDKTLSELDLRNKYGINVLSIKK